MPKQDHGSERYENMLREACLEAPGARVVDVEYEPVTSTQLSLLGEPEPISSVNGALLQMAKAVAAHYKSYHKLWRCKIDDARIIVRALRELGYSAAELCDCIDGYHASRWHRGENEAGKEYLYISLLLRDKEHINRGVRMSRCDAKTVLDQWSSS